MNSYPPGGYIANAINSLPKPGADSQPITVALDAGPLWGKYRITFQAVRNPRQGMTTWFWTMQAGERIDPQD